MNEKAGENVVDTNEVFSIKTKRPVNPEAPRGIVNQQLHDFEASKNISDSLDSERKLPEADAPVGDDIVARLPDSSKSPEWKHWEQVNGPIEIPVNEVNMNFDSLNTPTEPDQEKKREVSPEFEKASTEWREARERAHKIEEEYRTKYEAHILNESKGWRSFANVPRKMFGIQPNLTKELQDLQSASLIARRDYKEAGIQLRDTKSINGKSFSDVDKITERYQRMLAYHLTVAVHKERLAKQKGGESQAWKESKYLRPTMETLGKHKYLVALPVGVAVLTVGTPVLAGIAAGVGARFVAGKILDKTYVESARKNLAEGKSDVGEGFFESEFSSDDKEMERLTFDVGAREARAKTISNVAGIAAGVGAAGYVNGLGVESTVNNGVISPEVPPEPTRSGFLDSRTLEPLNMPEPSATGINDLPADIAPQVDGSSVDATAESVEGPLENETDGIESISPEPSEVISSNESETISPVDSGTESSIENLETSQNDIANETPSSSGVMGLTESEDLATFGPVIGPSIESLQTPTLHNVESGDNVWNILEGKGPDSNPVGGKSEVLEGMSQADREAALNKLVEYAEQNPEFAKEAGAVKSGGDIHRIHPGEQINVSMLDDKLRELLGIEANSPIPVAEASAVDVPQTEAPISEAGAEVADINSITVGEILDLQQAVAAGDPQAIGSLNALNIDAEGLQGTVNNIFESGTGDVDRGLTLGEYFSSVEPVSIDINSMSVGDILSMQEGVENGDPATLARLNEMGFDAGSYNALNESISGNIRAGESYDMNLPLTEWMSTYGTTEAASQAAGASVAVISPDSSAILDGTNYLPNSEGNNFYETSTPVAEGAEVLAEAVKGYVTGVEKGTGGFLFAGRPDVSGTFDALQNLTLGEFKSLAGSENLTEELTARGVSFDGFTRWGETLEEQARTIPANDNLTLGQYITSVVSNTRTA